jgi:hypothetical protein
MEKILTTEEKKYLRKISRYLNSFGIQYGELQFDLDSDDSNIPGYNHRDIPSYFNYNHMAAVPDGLLSIITKILDSLGNIDLYENAPSYIDYLDYQSYEIIIDSKRNEISVVHNIGWTEEGPSEGGEWDNVIEEWEKEGVLKDLQIPEDGILEVKYQGGGDSGYIEESFEYPNSDQVIPEIISDWCYEQLERNYGGWEINEGSQGNFKLDFKNGTVILQHTYNNDESKSNTLWEEEF